MAKLGYFIEKKTMAEIGHQLWLLRQERHLCLHNVYAQTHIPERVIDHIEIGRCANFGEIRRLIEFYGKKMTIKFE